MSIWIFVQQDGQQHKHDWGSVVTPNDMGRLVDEADVKGEGAVLRCSCGAVVTAKSLEV